ncbi:MAG: hypothetical protein FJ010_01290 [Chloroflexi bacterium]|nr:hypothetical protein [Chloroflexota bacterium]
MRLRKTPLLEITGVIAVGSGLLVLVLFLLDLSRPPRTPVGLVTVLLTVIPAPTETPVPATPAYETPVAVPDVPPAPGDLTIGAYVQVSGTDGDGLRVREGPGLGYEPRFVGLESEIFQVIEGPLEADGYVWWRLAAPYDRNISGWAVSNYLEVVEEP